MKDWYDKEYFDMFSRCMHYRPYIKSIMVEVKKYNPKTVLDVGCGIGVMVKRLREKGIDAVGIDFSPDAGKEIPGYFKVADAKNIPYPDNSFDLIISAGFFEHLKEEDIDQVYSEMKRVGGKIIANIGFKKSPHYHRKDGTLSPEHHITIKPREWWLKKIPEVIIINKNKLWKKY